MEDHRSWGVAPEDHTEPPVVRWWERRPVDMTAVEWAIHAGIAVGVVVLIGIISWKVWA